MRQVYGMNDNKDVIIIKKLNFDEFKNRCSDYIIDRNKKEILNILFVDVETTGLDRQKDKIVEIGLIEVQYNKLTSQIVSIGEMYESLEDPGVPLKGEIVKTIGLKDEDVKGKKIDWDKVNEIFKRNDIIASHNAFFDRGFIDRYLEESKNKIWGCTLKQINWREKDQGHDSASLMCLLRDHGCFSNNHRALEDVKSMVWLAFQIDPLTNYPYMKEVLSNIKIKNYWCRAKGNTYNIKDSLKENKYKWDGKIWKKKISEMEINTELIFADDMDFEIEIEPISYYDNFK